MNSQWSVNVNRVDETEHSMRRVRAIYLIHSSIGEEQRRIIVRYRRARMHILVPFALEEVDVSLPYLLRVHGGQRLGISRNPSGILRSCEHNVIMHKLRKRQTYILRRRSPYGLGLRQTFE